MKKFRIILIGTSAKEVFLDAKDEKTAVKKVDKMLFDDETLNFEFEDIKDIKCYSKEVKSMRREKYFNRLDNIPNDMKDTLINELLNSFHNAEKKVTKDGFLTIKVTKNDVRKITKLYDDYKKLCD